MKSRAITKAIVAGLVFSLLSAGAATAAGAAGNERMSRIERTDANTNRATETRRVEKFKSEATDSWLCNYVSPFFCTNLFPVLPSTPDPSGNSGSGNPPVRGRN